MKIQTDMLKKIKVFLKKADKTMDNPPNYLHQEVSSMSHPDPHTSLVPFHKYHGAGNDFILIDNTDGKFKDFRERATGIQKMCERRFGIGADGLVEICTHPDYQFEMRYYNSDGQLGSLCGNGMRCAITFFRQLGMLQYNEVTFLTSDGPHFGVYDEVNHLVHVKMLDVRSISRYGGEDFFVDTGSPHHVCFVADLSAIDVERQGREIRYNSKYNHGDPKGVNVNFVNTDENGLVHIRTYERGVEAETLACGTGAVAAVLASYLHASGKYEELSYQKSAKLEDKEEVVQVNDTKCCKIDQEATPHTHVQTAGGSLIVAFSVEGENSFRDIYLIGPVTYVYAGVYNFIDS